MLLPLVEGCWYCEMRLTWENQANKKKPQTTGKTVCWLLSSQAKNASLKGWESWSCSAQGREGKTERGVSQCSQISNGRVPRGWGRALFGGAQRQAKEQWAQTAARGVPSEREEKLCREGAGHGNRRPWEAVVSPLQVLRTFLDAFQCDLLQQRLEWWISGGPFQPLLFCFCHFEILNT